MGSTTILTSVLLNLKIREWSRRDYSDTKKEYLEVLKEFFGGGGTREEYLRINYLLYLNPYLAMYLSQ